MSRFIGNIDAKLDVKGRVFVPVTFRKSLIESGNQRFILRKDVYQECLVLYPENSWEETLTELRSRLNRWDPDAQNLYRKFVLEVEAVEMDSNGRILIPKRYLQLTGITSEVRFVGMDNTIEIWSKQKLENPLMDEDTFKKGIQQWMNP